MSRPWKKLVGRDPVRADRRLAALLAGATALMIVVLAPASARAFPQWQFSSGAGRCDQCHYGPAGGGLLTGYGQDAAGEEQSMFGGNGAFLHGKASLPGWLSVGGDFRGAFVAEDVKDPNGAKVAAFPMQAQVAARASVGDVSAYASVAYRGQIRSNDNIVPDQNNQPITASWLILPEHYLMWRPSAVGPYVRAGRFFAPFGLRFAEHVMYTRSDLGFDTMQESYNLSGGYVSEDYELHLTLSAPDFVRHMGSTESGVTAYFERRIADERGAVGVQARYAVSPGLSRIIVGAVGKFWVAPARTLLFVEADLADREVGEGAASTGSQGFVGAGGLAILPTRGLMVTMMAERSQTELNVASTATNGALGLLSWFPYAHTEVQLVGLLQFPSGTPVAKTFLAQLHYFL